MNDNFQLVTGVVQELEISPGQQAFLSSYQRQAGAAVAAGLVASGLSGVGVASAINLTGAGDSVEFFACRIGDTVVGGALSKVTFKNGDIVSAAVESVPDGALLARAVLRSNDAVLWIEPHCSRGGLAHKRYCASLALKIGFALLVLFSPFFWKAAHSGERHVEHLLFAGLVYGLMALTISLYYSVRFYSQWKRTAEHAEDIFRTLGFKNPGTVDLPRENGKTSRAQGVPWPYNTDGPWIYRCALSKR